MVTGAILLATEFCGFLCAHYYVTPPPTSRENITAVAHHPMYVTHLAAEKEALPSHVTTKFVKNSYTLLDDPSHRQLYTPNPSSTRTISDQRGR